MSIVSSKLEFRKAALKDASKIAGILYQSFIEFKSLYSLEAFNATVISEKKIKERIKEGDVWLALYEGEAAGTIASVEKTDGLYIRGMAVLPKARGLKIGKHLLEQVETEAYNKGYKRLFLGTTTFLYSAIKLYERSGFIKVINSNEDFFGTDLFIMEKFLISTT